VSSKYTHRKWITQMNIPTKKKERSYLWTAECFQDHFMSRTSLPWKAYIIQAVIYITICAQSAPLWVATPGYENCTTKHSTCTCSREQQIKIKKLLYNNHFKPLMCTTLGSDTLSLWKLYYS